MPAACLAQSLENELGEHGPPSIREKSNVSVAEPERKSRLQVLPPMLAKHVDHDIRQGEPRIHSVRVELPS